MITHTSRAGPYRINEKTTEAGYIFELVDTRVKDAQGIPAIVLTTIDKVDIFKRISVELEDRDEF